MRVRMSKKEKNRLCGQVTEGPSTSVGIEIRMVPGIPRVPGY